MLKVQRVYHYVIKSWTDENNEKWCESDITTDESIAKSIDENYRLAHISEVEEFVSLGFHPIEIVEVEEGVYYWLEVEYETLLGDREMCMKYIWIQNNSNWEIRDLSNMISRAMKREL